MNGPLSDVAALVGPQIRFVGERTRGRADVADGTVET